MGEYEINKKDMKFQSQDALKQLQAIIDEADAALNDKSRRMKDSPIQEVIAGAVGARAGLSGLYLGGSVAGLGAVGVTSGVAVTSGVIGGGIVAGLATIVAPAAIVCGGALCAVAHRKNKKLRDSKMLMYKNMIAKQTAIITELKDEADADKERIEYLIGVNNSLQSCIEGLQHDLGIAV